MGRFPTISTTFSHSFTLFPTKLKENHLMIYFCRTKKEKEEIARAAKEMGFILKTFAPQKWESLQPSIKTVVMFFPRDKVVIVSESSPYHFNNAQIPKKDKIIKDVVAWVLVRK